MAQEGKGKILYADDNQSLRTANSIALRRSLGCEVEEFPDGISLEERICSGIKCPTVIILDHDMPRKTGLELVKEYSRRVDYMGIPFVMCSGRGEDIRDDAMENGAFYYLEKPCELDYFLSTVKKAIEYSELFTESDAQFDQSPQVTELSQ